MPEFPEIKLKVSIVIPVYNRAFMLPQVIDSLLSQTYQEIEIILVDDGSTDSSFEIMKQYQNSRVYALKQANKGPASARNTGIRAATGDVILFMDSDAIAPPDLIYTHATVHQKNSNYIVQGQVVSILDLEEAFHMPFTFRNYSRAFFATGNVSVRKTHLQEVQGFDEENFTKGWEDLELGLRLRKKGLKVKRLFHKGFVWHYEANFKESDSIHDYFKERYREGQAAVTFYRKHPKLSVKLMTWAGKSFIIAGSIIFNDTYKTYLKSEKFQKKIESLWSTGKKHKAISKLRFAGLAYYLQGLRDKIQQDGYLLPPPKNPNNIKQK
jgi:glycosyltransferase involved in cell wall biosynthesis